MLITTLERLYFIQISVKK